ncbi:ABC transporter ATP-binding protein [Microbacterium esteraromaticum]|uniref:ABC transporter ATP-binding protein n=1 Tax=Microbacterium esteraromaticum TaxID=57043 RepID=A0A939DVK6_9MICO|nr:ABC transporter ATP-binding protein [Microbacterium esteraromaticum]MBN8205695.1 ABC transporter ATP-binding protein [Microbacterium esteraromaticum]MBN8415849.1 ABC transporter ATP-binding protein [Microbacterium esteraromaticum]
MKLILTTLRRLMPYLPANARRFLIGYGALTALLSVIDVIALMLLALVLAAAAAGNAVSLPVVGELPPDSLPWLIAVLSVLVVAKSAANVGLQWVATRRFASYELAIGERLFSAYIRAPWTERLGRNTAQIVQMADTGIANVVAGFLLPVTTLPGLVVTSLGVAGVIVFAQPLTALITVVYLGGIAMLQYAVLGSKTRQAGRVARDSALRVAALISGMVAALKEITLRGKAGEVETVVRNQRALTARARANVSFLSAVPRFVFDSAIIGGFLLTGGVAFVVDGIEGAIAAIALFGIAGFRLVPALTGFQSVITRTVTAAPYVDAVIGDIDASEVYLREQEQLGQKPLPAQPRVLSLADVGFTYPGSGVPAVADVSLTVPMGGTVGIAGSSGAGKSTLVDLLLGLITQTDGTIDIDGQPLEEVLAAWRRHVGYVPQDVTLFDGTIAQNIALTWGDDADLERAERAARRAQLWDVIAQRDGGLHSRVGERGLTLSGGQRQRLGIARALYAEPLVLVLDEATSALDTKTEADVSEAIRNLHGEVTVIAVAHRLSTIRNFDQIVFMKDGGVAAAGTFDEVVALSDDFAVQARLAGLA